MSDELLTAEEFADRKFDLPNAGRWVELVKGRIVTLHPPNDAHGRTLLNLSKTLASALEINRQGYFCFELAVSVARNPDTVRSPAACFFVDGPQFGEMDEIVSFRIPAIVIELASTPDRQKSMQQRVDEYQALGTELVWIIDVGQRSVNCIHSNGERFSLSESETLTARPTWTCERLDRPLLEGFNCPISTFFEEPDWWTGKSSPSV
ncbi:MAG: hypothetical protein CMJ78_15495 [Planctomycetaceae bacterium]|nr:hypothetical protein [Planctomycetaceae bacterium]